MQGRGLGEQAVRALREGGGMSHIVVLTQDVFGTGEGLQNHLRTYSEQGYRLVSVGYDPDGLPVTVFLEKD